MIKAIMKRVQENPARDALWVVPVETGFSVNTVNDGSGKSLIDVHTSPEKSVVIHEFSMVATGVDIAMDIRAVATFKGKTVYTPDPEETLFKREPVRLVQPQRKNPFMDDSDGNVPDMTAIQKVVEGEIPDMIAGIVDELGLENTEDKEMVKTISKVVCAVTTTVTTIIFKCLSNPDSNG
jgi:hypothetical protein